jgi:hypothetical protein
VILRAAAAVLVTAMLLVGTALLSNLPYGSDPVEAAIRLSWRVRGERIEACRRLTPEEMAALPVHMRREEVCEGRIAPYHLTVELDGRVIEDVMVRPAGARGDRPVYVYRDYAVPPGEHPLRVIFRLEDEAAETPPLIFDGTLRLAAGEVALLTIDATQNRFVVRGAGLASVPPAPAPVAQLLY